MGQLALQSAFGRRSFMRSAACAGLCAAAPVFGLLTEPAKSANWRGLVGCVKPRANDSALVDMIRLLPPGIGVAPVYLNFAEGTREEFQNSYANYEKNVAYLASLHCDIIDIEGAPPFMILGPEGEAKLIDGWKQKYKTDMFTSSQNQVNVLKAMKIKNIFGFTPFGADLNNSYAKYFVDCGVGVLAMEGMDVSYRLLPTSLQKPSTPQSRRSFWPTRGRMPSTFWDRPGTRSASSQCSNRILAFRSCKPLRRASGRFSGAYMFASRSRAMERCWRPCRHSP
jgi:hypothetical protein